MLKNFKIFRFLIGTLLIISFFVIPYFLTDLIMYLFEVYFQFDFTNHDVSIRYFIIIYLITYIVTVRTPWYFYCLGFIYKIWIIRFYNINSIESEAVMEELLYLGMGLDLEKLFENINIEHSSKIKLKKLYFKIKEDNKIKNQIAKEN